MKEIELEIEASDLPFGLHNKRSAKSFSSVTARSRSQLYNIYEKLDLESRVALVLYATEAS